MSTVTITVDTMVQAQLPVGTTAGALRYSILASDGSVVQTGDSTASSLTFPNDVPDGSYTASVARLDSNGKIVGTAITVPFSVPVPVVMVDIPSTITVTVS